ncbi:MAG: hypothetical protein ACOCM4_02180 [Acetivibrio ethanolgignens]
MLTVMPQAPSVTGVYQVRDFVPQLNYMSENGGKALRSAFDFAMDLQNEAVKSKQRDVLNKEIDRQTLLKENIENDKVLLAKLEKDLEQLKAGNDVELRQGESLMQQNNVPEMQKYLDALHKTDENKSFWNFKPAEV